MGWIKDNASEGKEDCKDTNGDTGELLNSFFSLCDEHCKAEEMPKDVYIF